MKKLICLIFAMLCTSMAFANPVKTLDGTSALCKTKYDAYNSQRENVFRLSDLKYHNETEETISVSVKITFLTCVENDKGQFSFVPKENHFTSSFKVLSMAGEWNTIDRVDTEKTILAINNEVKVVAKSSIESDESSSRAFLTLNKDELTQNIYVNGRKEKYLVHLALRTKSDFYQNGKKELSAPKTSGFFALYLDVK